MTLDVLTDAQLAPLAHGFFTRTGGASSGIYRGLNCGQGSGDQRDAVLTNRARVAAHLDLAPDHLVSLAQVHSAKVEVLNAPPDARPEADAMVTTTPGLALGVLSADCAPVLFADAKHRVIGAAHSGWKGAFGGVLEATVEAMIALGAAREDLRAVIGPTISQRAYEVGPEFFDRLTAEDPQTTRFFAQGDGDRLQFDLPGYALGRLTDVGVQAHWTGHCTYSDEARFYSYRRATHRGETDYGRLISAIRL
ncbi:MAG: peptidoglycan editing factor PgeF [Pseudomonadota bacterium]